MWKFSCGVLLRYMTGTFSGTGFLGSCTGGTTLHLAMAGTKYWYFALCNDLRFWVPVLSTGTLHFATTSEFGCQYWYQHFASHFAVPPLSSTSKKIWVYKKTLKGKIFRILASPLWFVDPKGGLEKTDRKGACV